MGDNAKEFKLAKLARMFFGVEPTVHVKLGLAQRYTFLKKGDNELARSVTNNLETVTLN